MGGSRMMRSFAPHHAPPPIPPGNNPAPSGVSLDCMRQRARTPGLALPFAVVGFAAGWLSDGFLANPLVGVASHHSQTAAGCLAAATGAVLGALLERHAR